MKPILLKYPHIEQYRNVIRYVKNRARYKGKDAEGEPIYDALAPLPKLEFLGSVKLHGTNAAICQNALGDYWTQSRERILTAEDDNAGFCVWVANNSPAVNEMFTYIRKYLDHLPKGAIVAVYGEWCGQGIQKGVAVSQLSKRFVVFGIRIFLSDGTPADDDSMHSWMDPITVKILVSQSLQQYGIWCIYHFPTWKRTIDFEQPELIQNELGAITEEVEAECPFSNILGVKGIGEGVVWQCITDKWRNSDMLFKVKGEKHSVSKVKVLAAVDLEKVNSVKECVEKIVTENRMEQGLDYLRQQNLEIDLKNMGHYLKWLASDAIREESDTITASGLSPKDVGKAISDKGRKWFIKQLGSLPE